MVNNVGKTTKTLNINLGGSTIFEPEDNLTIITGEVGLGLLIFDEDGTLGVISAYTDNESDFTVTTYAKSIDIETILSLTY